VDRALFHLINEQWTHPALDLFMAALSDMNIWMPLLVIGGIAVLVFGGFKGRAFVFCLVVTIAVSEALVIRSLKSAIGRPRPKQTETVRLVQLQRTTPKFLTVFKQPRIHYSTEHDLRQRGAGSSFPSGHVTNNFVAATFCTLFWRARGALFFVVALLIGYARVYLGAHWPSDIVATIFLAAGLALLMAAVLEWLWRTAGKRWLPQTFARHPRLITSS
jgi:undecaprenyl-diphosphatase